MQTCHYRKMSQSNYPRLIQNNSTLQNKNKVNQNISINFNSQPIILPIQMPNFQQNTNKLPIQQNNINQKHNERIPCKQFHKNFDHKKHQIDRHSQSNLATKVYQLNNIMINQSLFILQSILGGCLQAKKIFGWFSYDKQFFNISQNGKIITDFCKMTKSQNINNKNDAQIISDMLDDIKKYSNSSFHDFYAYYKRTLLLRQNIDIKYLISLIKSYRICSKLKNITQISQQTLNKSKQLQTDLKKQKRYQLPYLVTSRVTSKFKNSRKFYQTDQNILAPTARSQRIRKSISLQKNKFWQKTTNGLISPVFFNTDHKNIQSQLKSKQNTKIFQQSQLSQSNVSLKSKQSQTKNCQIDCMLKSISLNCTNQKPFLNLQRQDTKQSINKLMQKFKQSQKSIKKEISMQNIKKQLFNKNVLQVESLGSFSEADISDYSSRNSISAEEKAQIMKIRQNEAQTLQKNNWVRNIDNLFHNRKQIQVSLILKSSKKNHNKTHKINDENSNIKPISAFQGNTLLH